MLVLGVTDTLTAKWCQVLSGGRKYTCPTRVINGEMFFRFKKTWHPVAQFASEYAEVLIEEGGKLFSVPFKK